MSMEIRWAKAVRGRNYHAVEMADGCIRRALCDITPSRWGQPTGSDEEPNDIMCGKCRFWKEAEDRRWKAS